MKYKRVIQSLLDTDLYKLSVLRAFFHKMPDAVARYEFKNRTKGVKFTAAMLDEIQEQIDDLCTLQFTEEEVQYIGSIYYMAEAKGFLEFLRMFKLNRDYIGMYLNGDDLVVVAEGPLWMTSMFEIYVLAIVNEVYFRHTVLATDDSKKLDKMFQEGWSLLRMGVADACESPVKFIMSDFGTRRRFSRAWHEEVVKYINDTYQQALPQTNFVFAGTSNVLLAKKLGITPIGTHGHEFFMACQAINGVPIASSQQHAMQLWQDEYDGALGYCLGDTLGIDKFFKDFNRTYAKLFDGVRQDSGDPVVWGYRLINHYEALGVDPKSKQVIFSDSLDFPRALLLAREFAGRIKASFGIGTKLTNNFGDYVQPLNIVFKMTTCNNKPVAKLADGQGKTMCTDDEYLKYLKYAIQQ